MSEFDLTIGKAYDKSKSALGLGETPPAYDLMRHDPASFDRTFEGLEDNDGCVQWVWRGLQDAATLAQQHHQPILGNGL